MALYFRTFADYDKWRRRQLQARLKAERTGHTPQQNEGGGFIDFSNGLPDDWSEQLINFSAQGVGMEPDSGGLPYPYPGLGDQMGCWGDEDVITDGSDIDMELTFVWYAAADTTTQSWGPALLDPSSDTAAPAVIKNVSDRNFNRVRPGKRIASGAVTETTLTNGLSTSALSGGELTADGVTTHTIGFRISNGMYTAYFDGTIKDGPFALDAGEQALVAGTTRVGISYQAQDVTTLTEGFIAMQWGPAGSIYT